jgi:hypothetical protein
METTVNNTELLSKMFSPDPIGNFFQPYEGPPQLKIIYFSSPTSPGETILLENIYPFFTLDDVKLAIYQKKEENPKFAPNYQFLATAIGDVDEGAHPSQLQPLQVKWIPILITKKDSITEQYRLTDPLLFAEKGRRDPRFVDTDGSRIELGYVNNAQLTLEDLFSKRSGFPTIYLYVFNDVYTALKVQKPLSEKYFNGIMRPYFPFTDITTTGLVLSKEKQNALRRIEKKKGEIKESGLLPNLQLRQRLISCLDRNLENEEYSLAPATISGIKSLRIVFIQGSTKGRVPLDTNFFSLKTTHFRPFLRYIPVMGTAVSKIQMKSTLPIPDIEEPSLLLDWGLEKSPTRERDFLMMKILLKQSFIQQPPVYATLRWLDDGTADILVKPPKSVKKLSPTIDLRDFQTNILEAIKDLPFANQPLQIQDSNFVLDIDLPREKARIDNNELIERARLLRGFFQELGRLEGESPDINLRYRAVSNFVNEDRISNYLTQIASRPGLFEESVSVGEDIIELLMEEFQLSLEEAKQKAEKWFKDRAALYKADPDNNVFKLQNNPGIDIAIYNKHPNYNIHIYRVDSYINLRRVILLLQIMISWPLKVLQKCLTDSTAEESQEREEIEAEENQLSADRELAAQEGDLGSSETEATSSTENSGESIKIYGVDEDSDEEEEEKVPVAKAVSQTLAAEERTFKPQAASVLPSGAVPSLKPTGADGKPCKSPQGTIKIANYFITHLYDADKALFGYAIGKKGMKPYTRACSATEDRMPAVMTPEQYQRMRDEYEEDEENEEISFIEYPLRPGDEEKDKGDIENSETYTVLRYGTDIANEHYYICCQYFCLKDTIMIREKDFLSTKDRQDPPQPKPARTCPFCCGKEIKNFPDFANEGETVFVRKNKPKYDIPHKYVGFYSKQIHPDPRNFGLPCCFTGPKAIKITDSAFRFRQLQDEPEDYRERNDEDEDEEEGEEIGDSIIPNYTLLFQSLHRQYILGAEKMPLEIGKMPQIGLLPTVLNEYFNQKPTDLIVKGGIRQILKEESSGFLRVAVQNQIQHNEEALFSAVAPFIKKLSTAKDVRQQLEMIITPRVFVNLSYGNLLLEFYKPDLPDPNLISSKRNFRDFINELGVVEKDNSFVLKRAWKSYWAFKDFLADKREVKELRQFAPIFAEPKLFSTNGIVFIVLEVLANGELQVRCPPYGFAADAMRGCDIGFLYHSGNIWEPIVYTKNVKQAAFAQKNDYKIKWQMAKYAEWPEIVQKRVNEFKTTCSGPGVAAYTSAIDTDPKTLLPFTKAIRILPSSIPMGIVRDIYNHLAAVTIPVSEDETMGQIAVPVVDDGLARTELRLYLGWDQYEPAPVNYIIQFYREKLQNLLSLYEGYQVIKVIREEETKIIMAVQLANGIFIPAKEPTSEEELNKYNIPIDDVKQEDFDWILNKQIYMDTSIQSREESTELDMDEVYQHLRLIFANWLSTPMGTEAKKFIQGLLNDSDPYQRQLPIWEKRKRLEVVLAPALMKWMDDEGEYPIPGPALLRKDCRILKDKEQCDGYCKWRSEGGAGKCYLHVPKELELNGKMLTSGKRILYLRLFDELIRYPKKREQLFNKSVSSLVTLKKKLSIKDSTGAIVEEVYPEDSFDWFNLLRLEWTTKRREVSKWFEELTGTAEKTKQEIARYQVGITRELTDDLKRYLSTGKEGGGEIDAKVNDYQLFSVNPTSIEAGKEWIGILGYMGFNPAQIFKEDVRTIMSGLQLRDFVRFTQKNIIQINLSAEEEKKKFSGWIFVPNPENETYIFIIQENKPYYLSNKKQALFAPLKDSMIPPPLLDKILGLQKITPPEKLKKK